MSDPEDEILRAMRKAIEKSRGYASYWEWKLDKREPELEAARAVGRFLFRDIKCEPVSFSKDPPDVVLIIGSRKIGIEVTEIVDQAAVERAAKRKRLGLPIEYDWGEWDRSRLEQAITFSLEEKGRKLANATSLDLFDEVFLALVTDETMITEQLVQSVLETTQFEASIVSRGFVIMSYHPGADPNTFPDKCPIFELVLKSDS